MKGKDDPLSDTRSTPPAPAKDRSEPQASIIDVYHEIPEDYDGSCLRPLGLCELGGCCDTCWYRPDNPHRTVRKAP